MNKNDKFSNKEIHQINKYLDTIESEISKLRKILNCDNEKSESFRNINTRIAENYIEGVFDGQAMIDEAGKKYMVPENYASKTKLICGDKLKLVVSDTGLHIFKLIEPVERIRVKGELVEDGTKIYVIVNGKKYKILKASFAYFKLKSGDIVNLLLPKDSKSVWAVIENKI